MAVVNLSGLSKSVIKCTRKDKWDGEYWDSSGNHSPESSGKLLFEEFSDGYCHFASYDKIEVNQWLRGARAVMKQLGMWSK